MTWYGRMNLALGMGLFKHSPGMTQEAFGQEFDWFFFQPLSILISLENGQIHLHIKSWRTFRTFPGKCRENDCSSIFCLKNGVTWVTPFSIGKFPWGCYYYVFFPIIVWWLMVELERVTIEPTQLQIHSSIYENWKNPSTINLTN